jgi:hypothetical protein
MAMLLRFRPRKTKINVTAATALHSAALAALWMSEAFNSILVVFTLAISLNLFIVLRALSASDEITSIHFQQLSTHIRLYEKCWIRVEVTVHRCDRLMVVMKLHCLDSDSSFFKQSWLLWIIPGVISANGGRRLRRFIRWQHPY